MKFNVDEIYEIAEQLERNGAKFYRQAARIAPNDKARELMNSLAAMEAWMAHVSGDITTVIAR